MDKISLRKRFCKDNNISIQLFDDPFFTERLKLMGEYESYAEFEQLIKDKFGDNPEKYFEYYNDLKDRIIDYIKASEAFQLLNSDDMNKYTCNCEIKQSDVYKMPNIGKKFISIDMRKANFSSLVHYGEKNGCPFNESYSWVEFMSKFTDIEHFINSKYIRQVVFGNCNPRRQVTYEKYLMSRVLDCLLRTGTINKEDIYSMCHDEIILFADRFTSEEVQYIVDSLEHNLEIPLRVEYFTLGKITNSDAFVKKIENFDGTTELVPKCLSSIEAPSVYRMLNGEEPNDRDNYFFHDGRIAKYLESRQYSITFKQGE